MTTISVSGYFCLSFGGAKLPPVENRWLSLQVMAVERWSEVRRLERDLEGLSDC